MCGRLMRQQHSKPCAHRFALTEIQSNGGIEDQDLTTLEAYYTAEIPAESDFRRRNLAQLLNNWQGEIDRAARWNKQTNKPKLKSLLDMTQEERDAMLRERERQIADGRERT